MILKSSNRVLKFNTKILNFETDMPISRLVPMMVFTGESNSGGYAANSDATTLELSTRPQVQILNNNNLLFEDLRIGTNNIIGHTGTDATWQTTRHGWELELANLVAAAAFMTNKVYLVKTGQGGSTIAQWNTGGAYWNTFLQRIDAAKALLRTTGNIATVYVWYSQGINDSIAGTNVGTWKAATIAHIAKIRAKLGYVPIMFTYLPSSYTAYNAAWGDIAAADDFLFPIQTSDAGLQSDGNHWTYSGMKLIADRMTDVVTKQVGEFEQYTYTQEYKLSLRAGSTGGALPIGVENIDWTNETNTTDVGNGTLQGNNTTTPAGALASKHLVTGGYVEFDVTTAAANSEALALTLTTSNNNNYNWNDTTNPIIGTIYHFGGNVSYTETSTGTTGFSLGSLGSYRWLRLKWTGNDLLYQASLDGTTYTTLRTSTGLMTGVTNAYIKGIMAINASTKVFTTTKGSGLQ